MTQIIRQRGGQTDAWRFFRKKEFEVLQKISRLTNVIVDCGGGIVVDLDAAGLERFSLRKARLLRKNAVVVWLKADVDALARKNAADPRRPSLNAAANERDIMRRRRPYYARAAHIAVKTNDSGAKEIAARILKKIRHRLNRPIF